jgi:hypothetical protein
MKVPQQTGRRASYPTSKDHIHPVDLKLALTTSNGGVAFLSNNKRQNKQLTGA